MNEINQNGEFINRILETANSFLQEHKFDSAKDIYSEVTIQYPDRYEGWYGYIRAITCDFTKMDVSRRLINNIREDEQKVLSLCKDEKEKNICEERIEAYLDSAYDDLQTRLEIINADANKLQHKQIAQEQIAKREFEKETKKEKKKKIISQLALVIFLILTVVTLVFSIINLVEYFANIDTYVGDKSQVLVCVVWLLLLFICAVFDILLINIISKIRGRINRVTEQFEEDNIKRSKVYNKEYKKSQKEYEYLTKE